jgi:PEP-CTERM motif
MHNRFRISLTKPWIFSAVAAACLGVMAPYSQATQLPGTVLTSPGATVFPGLIATGTPAGTLLASLIAPYSFSTTAGVTSGTLTSAVYRNTSGTLDFYYQVDNSSNSATAIARETDTSFLGFITWTGFRVDAVGPFVAGTAPPVTADSNLSGGTVIGFSFNPPESAKVGAGINSDILVISTNATNYVPGNASVIDGGTQTVAAFQPASVPEPGSLILLGGGLLALGCFRRRAGKVS